MFRRVDEFFPQFRLGMKNLRKNAKCHNLHFVWIVLMMCIQVLMLQIIMKRNVRIKIHIVRKPRLEIKAGQPWLCHPNN